MYLSIFNSPAAPVRIRRDDSTKVNDGLNREYLGDCVAPDWVAKIHRMSCLHWSFSAKEP